MFYFTLNSERLFVHFGIFCINIGGEAFAPYLSIPPKFLIRLFRHFECSDNHVGDIGLGKISFTSKSIRCREVSSNLFDIKIFPLYALPETPFEDRALGFRQY